jgi:hypothetical protein
VPVRYTPSNVRPLEPIREKLASDPVAKVNQSAFVILAVRQFCAAGLVPKATRILAVELDGCKSADRTFGIHILKRDLKHFIRYAKAAGVGSFSALVQSALAHHFRLSTFETR